MNSEQDKFPEGSGNDAVLTSLSVQLNMTSQDPEFLKQKQFPVAMKPKNLIVSMAGHRISSNIASGRTSAARSLDFRKSIPRPRNKFIIARTMLSKLVKTGYSCNTDDKSKIISILWCHGEGAMQEYFSYLSFVETQWHEIYYPNYRFTPKAKTASISLISNGCTPVKRIQNDTVIELGDVSLIKHPYDHPQPDTILAQNIQDSGWYVNICASSYHEPSDTPAGSLSPEGKDYEYDTRTSGKYKEHTSKFSIRPKVLEVKKSRPITSGIHPKHHQSSRKKRQSQLQNDFIVKSFISPLYGQTEEVFYKTSSESLN